MDSSEDKAPLICSQRFLVSIMALFGTFFIYSERVNLSVAILCMVGTPDDDISSPLGLDPQNGTNQTNFSDVGHNSRPVEMSGEVNWTKSMQSQLLAMYFYGYVLTQLLGGWLSSRFGTRRVWGFCHVVSAICTLLTPVSARTHFYFICAVRFVVGMGAGVTFPAVYSLLGRWAPPLERSKLVSYIFCGPLLGWIATLAVSGFLCEYGFDNGWGSIFYLCGMFNLIWIGAWFFIVADGPEKQKRISEREKDYILKAIGRGNSTVVKKTPWLKMAKSLPLWAIIIAHMGSSYTTNTLLTSLPMFMKEALNFDIKQNGLLSALPTVCQFLSGIVWGFLADRAIERRWLSVKNTRKIWQTISSLGAAIMFCIAVQLDEERRYGVVAILCIATSLESANRGGYLSNHLDLAPRYSGILMGITNTCSNAFGIISPLVAGALTPNGTAEEWKNVFYVTAGICVVGSIAFFIMADGELQDWAVDHEKDDIELDVKPPMELENVNGRRKDEGDTLLPKLL